MDIKDKLISMRQNRIVLEIAEKDKYKRCATRFGGQPDVPRSFIWPTFEGKDYDDVTKERPLAFLAQFNCTELIEFDIEKRLPDHGLLSFFYELDTQRWGYDPNDRGCARVYWFEDLSQLSAAEFPDELDVEYRLPILNIRLSAETSLPSLEDFLTAFPQETDDSYIAAYNELTAASDTYSQLLGWPDVLQNNMYTECDLVSKGCSILSLQKRSVCSFMHHYHRFIH